MPKGKGKGRRGAGETKAERALRRAIARELPAIKAVAECCDGFRDEWRALGGDDHAEDAVAEWPRVVVSRDGVVEVGLGTYYGAGSDSLVALPDAIGDFASLTQLDLKSCKNLLAVPDTIGKLGSLVSLILVGCGSLTALPYAIGELGALEFLNVTECRSLAALPDSLGELGSLKYLSTRNCSSLTVLPESFRKLWLTELNLSGTSLSIPDSIGDLIALKTLYLNDCVSLTFLPSTICDLRSLEGFSLRGCSGLVELPYTIHKLKALAKLDVSKCSSLTALPTTIFLCDSLRVLDASESGLTSVKISFTRTLRTLNLSGCESLLALSSSDGPKIIGAEDVPRYPSADRIWDRLEQRRCCGCGRQFGLDAPRVRVCGRCRWSYYCGIECQRAHWEQHRERCRRIRRICAVCARVAEDTDRPFPTCHCGKRRYCGEACQVKDWYARHAKTCKSGYLYLEG